MSSNSGATCAPAFMPLDIPNDEQNFAYEKAWILVIRFKFVIIFHFFFFLGRYLLI